MTFSPRHRSVQPRTGSVIATVPVFGGGFGTRPSLRRRHAGPPLTIRAEDLGQVEFGTSSHSPCHKLTSGRTEIDKTLGSSSVAGLARQKGLTGVGGNASVPAIGATCRLSAALTANAVEGWLTLSDGRRRWALHGWIAISRPGFSTRKPVAKG